MFDFAFGPTHFVSSERVFPKKSGSLLRDIVDRECRKHPARPPWGTRQTHPVVGEDQNTFRQGDGGVLAESRSRIHLWRAQRVHSFLSSKVHQAGSHRRVFLAGAAVRTWEEGVGHVRAVGSRQVFQAWGCRRQVCLVFAGRGVLRVFLSGWQSLDCASCELGSPEI